MKPFFVISALLEDSLPMGKLKRHTKQKDAIEHAKQVIERRRIEGARTISFHVLKVVAVVETSRPPIRVVLAK